MALRFHLPPPQSLLHPLKSQNHPFPSSITTLHRTKTLIISCTSRSRSRIRDAELASDLAAEIENMNAHLAQRSDAMKKSREILFTELCQHLSSAAGEVKKKWGKMGEEEKWVLVKGFVSAWGVDFHPLSARSVKELVEEHLGDDNPPPTTNPPSPSPLFPRLKNMMGFWDSLVDE